MKSFAQKPLLKLEHNSALQFMISLECAGRAKRRRRFGFFAWA